MPVGGYWVLNSVVMPIELRAEFDFTEWYYVKPFVKRWKRKVKKTKNVDVKQYEFDSFIAKYLIYAALVNVIKPHEYRTRKDRAFCTEVMASFILSNTTNDFLLIQNLSTPATKLGETIKNYHFYVVSSNDENPELETTWKLGSNKEKLISLLQTLYYMRCNIFHGNKEYADEQVLLLNPANNCLEIIIKEIQQIFNNFSFH